MDLSESLELCYIPFLGGCYFFSPLPRLIHHELVHQHPIETTTMKMCVLIVLPAWSCSCYPLFSLTFSDNLYCQMILGVLIYRQSDVRALLNFQSSRMYLFSYLTWLVVFSMITDIFFSHSSVQLVFLNGLDTFSYFQVFSEPGPTNMKYPGFNLPK